LLRKPADAANDKALAFNPRRLYLRQRFGQVDGIMDQMNFLRVVGSTWMCSQLLNDCLRHPNLRI
jgi:hypothetical protein